MNITPNAARLRRDVRAFTLTDPLLSALLADSPHTQWPVGYRSCRKIAGSRRWSRHAWGDACDVMKLTGTGNAKPGQDHYLDRIYEHLDTHRAQLGIDNLIWRTTRHWNHLHADFTHHGIGTPPCAGGTLRTTSPAGGFVLMPDQDGNVPVPEPGDPEVEEVVKGIQKSLKQAGFDPGKIDGDWGPNTQAAHDEMTTAAADGGNQIIVDHTHPIGGETGEPT